MVVDGAAAAAAEVVTDVAMSERLVELLRGKRIVALTGAGCSTDSGIPDYRGPTTPPRARPPIQHREFIDHESVRRRYWARSMIGWPVLRDARPNVAHHALAQLERAGLVHGLITQNVDGLHDRAGSPAVELHGAIRRVRCLACDARISRAALQEELVARNPRYASRAAQIRPDGDAELDDDPDFTLVPCAACGGTLMPDVVFFGGNVPKPTLDAAWEVFDRADVLLVVGSSLTVFSGYRFVRRAVERAIPVAIVNRGPTRGDADATLLVDAGAAETLAGLAATLDHRDRE